MIVVLILVSLLIWSASPFMIIRPCRIQLRFDQLRTCSVERSRFSCRQCLSLKGRSDDDETSPKLQLLDDNDGPKVSVRSLEEVTVKPSSWASISDDDAGSKTTPSAATMPVKTKTGSKKSIFGDLSVQDLVAEREERIRQRGGKRSQKEDLNGIDPLTPFLFSTVPAVMSLVGWQISTFLAANFAIQYLDSELYPVQRIAIVGRNLVVGLFTLQSGFCASISLGLFLLGVTVTVGVAKGELDPAKKKVINDEVR